jgi:predicted Zn-dependent peptidase
MIAEIERLQREAPPAAELERVKNRNLARRYRDIRTNEDLMYELLTAEGLGDWRVFFSASEAVRAVTPQAISAAARTYFTDTGKNVMWIERNAGLDDPKAGDGGAPASEQ